MYADFSSVALDGLRTLLPAVEGWAGNVDAAARHILDGFASLAVHPDVPDGVRALSDAGFRLVTMTNGSATLTQQLLARAGLADRFEALLDVSGPRRWKPARAAYQYVIEQVRVRPGQALLVAVHPWDIDGAQRAGLGGAWLRRGATVYPHTMSRPSHSAQDLRELAEVLLAERT